MFKKLKDLFKNTPKTYKVRIYNKHTDDDTYCLMGNHEVEKEILDALLHCKEVGNRTVLHYSIDSVDIEFGKAGGTTYILSTSTIWSKNNEKPSCYTKQWFIPREHDHIDD